MTAALFAGSFNPFTIGHANIVERGLALFDKIYIAVGANTAKGADSGELSRRVAAIRGVYASNPRVQVLAYSSLTTDLAREIGATHLLRGVRSVADFEYERNLADINRTLSGIDTVLLIATPELACISSSMVRELMSYDKDVSKYLP